MRIVPGTQQGERLMGLAIGHAVVAGMLIYIFKVLGPMGSGWLLVIPSIIAATTWWWFLVRETDALLRRVRPSFRGRVARWGGTARYRSGWATVPGYLFITDMELIFCRRPLMADREKIIMPLERVVGFCGKSLGVVDRAGKVQYFQVKSSYDWRVAIAQACVSRKTEKGKAAPERQAAEFELVERGEPYGLIIAALALRGLAWCVPRHAGVILALGLCVLTAWGIWGAIRWRRGRARALGRLQGLDEGRWPLLAGVAGVGELLLTDRELIYFRGGRAERYLERDEIPLQEIRAVEVRWSGLVVHRKHGGEEVFPVDQAKRWVERVSAALKRNF